MTNTAFEQPTDELPRDRWGRPLVIPPEGGKPVPYTRCTTYVGCLEDTYNLGLWQQRMVATGLAQRPDLLLQVSSLGMQPTKGTPDYKKWRAGMDEACGAAREAAAASSAATIGTALHALTERLDRGLDVGIIPDSYKPHLAAYEQATATFEAVHIEQFTVNDDLKIGGTPDRILKIDGHDKLVVGDLKTGDTEYGIGKMCMQLSVYAHSLVYHPATGQRAPLGDVDLDRGLIIALNATTGQCELKWIDLAAGWDAVQLATQVRAWRARKGLATPYQPTTDAPPATPAVQPAAMAGDAEAALIVAIKSATNADELVQLWTAAGNRWTDQHTALAAERKAQLQTPTQATA